MLAAGTAFIGSRAHVGVDARRQRRGGGAAHGTLTAFGSA